ncbi:hypothetical protein FACS189491_02480 [Spirochaetia bacterium]|nr:hypothetical protein FACS189491_02480 [Spirochaetia bacterium]
MSKKTDKPPQTSEKFQEKVPKELFCSFCNKNSKLANRLIAGPNDIFICEECVAVCTRILFEENSIAAIAQKQRPEALAEFLGTKFITPLGKQFSVPTSRLYPTYKSRVEMGYLIKQIFESMLVIADVTGKDPILMYLLGIVKSLGRPLFILTQNLADIPSDLKGNRHVKYDETEESLLDIQSQLSPAFEFIGYGKVMFDTKKLVKEREEHKKEEIQEG